MPPKSKNASFATTLAQDNHIRSGQWSDMGLDQKVAENLNMKAICDRKRIKTLFLPTLPGILPDQPVD